MQEQADAPVKVPQRVHLSYLDGLRGIAALYVVAFHIRVYSLDAAPAVLRLTSPLGFGSCTVAVFIVLSGF